ncbi:hypothetical protein D9758_009432 [Tetrapyrgos nigripes]|uniref:F-box domain-containing protein n=1 Tax=Tetrapyrgos nigripes TaxID=182062 RepID=A0A8H5FWT8_9AGAR|nr:hypothetical protein D9758_009432 [Tetrapyrgos nigripes]
MAIEAIPLCSQCNHSFLPKFHCGDLLSDVLEQLQSFYWPTRNDGYADTDGLQDEINRFDSEINQIRQSLSALEDARNALVRVKECRPALYSPIRKLPIEILQHTFSFCAHTPELDEHEILERHCRQRKQVAFVTLPILNVAQSCSFWRKVCLSRADFWADMTFFFDTLYDTYVDPRPHTLTRAPSLLPLVNQYLMRSKSSPLTINFHAFAPIADDSGGHFPKFDRFVRELLIVLLEEAGRWQSVVFALDCGFFRLDLIDQYTIFPLLEHLSIILPEEQRHNDLLMESWSGPEFTQWVSGAPISRLMIPWCRGLDLPLHSLTSVTIHHLEDSSAHILEGCPSLQQLRILSYRTRDNWSAIRQFLSLSHLEIWLSPEPEFYPNVLDVFDHMTLPSLSTLIVKSEYDGWTEWDGSGFTLMVLRSKCRLETLSFTRIDMTIDDVGKILSLTPHLTHFTLHLNSTMGADEVEDADCPFVTILKNLCVKQDHHDEPNPDDVSLTPSSSLPWTIPKYLIHVDIINLNYSMVQSIIDAACDMLKSRFDNSDYSTLEYFRLHGTQWDSDMTHLDKTLLYQLASDSGSQYSIL